MSEQEQKDFFNKLNGILQGELSACETYRIALDKIEDAGIKTKLKECHISHNGRVDTLVEKIVSLGGSPVENSGAWGSFAKMMEGGATVFGDKAAVALLEEGEDKGLSDYKKLLEDNNLDLKAVASAMMCKQESTHSIMRDLKHSM